MRPIHIRDTPTIHFRLSLTNNMEVNLFVFFSKSIWHPPWGLGKTSTGHTNLTSKELIR